MPDEKRSPRTVGAVEGAQVLRRAYIHYATRSKSNRRPTGKLGPLAEPYCGPFRGWWTCAGMPAGVARFWAPKGHKPAPSAFLVI